MVLLGDITLPEMTGGKRIHIIIYVAMYVHVQEEIFFLELARDSLLPYKRVVRELLLVLVVSPMRSKSRPMTNAVHLPL